MLMCVMLRKILSEKWIAGSSGCIVRIGVVW